MNDSRTQVNPTSSRRAAAREMLRWFASTKLAVGLIVLLAVVLAAATVLESAKGRDYSQWYVYKSPWFMALLSLLALNILAATAIRFPWRRGRRGFLLTHLGLLVLLAGAILTFWAGVDGQLVLVEGETGDTILMTDRSQLITAWRKHETQPPSAFTFEPGPADWPEGTTLPMKPLNGVELEVLKFYRHARTDVEWVEDSSAAGHPAVQLALASADGTPMVQEWLTANPFTDEVFLGPLQLSFQQASMASMREDFNNPPSGGAETDGVLSMHYKDQMYRVPIKENVGKKVAVGKSDIRVEITSYLPDARPDAAARFTTASKQPNNPLLELRVYEPGKDQPQRQIAFARYPLLNLDMMHGGKCPVKFWYHHPAVTLKSGTQFLQTPDGKLHYRVIADGKLLSHGEAKQGAQIETGGKLRLSIVGYLPHARQKVSFLPVNVSGNDAAGPESAVLVKVLAGGQSNEVWLKRADSEYGFQQITTPEGVLGIGYGYERMPLGFSLKLVSFQHELNPGMMGDASFASSVRVIDKDHSVGQPAEISMNQPLVHGGFTFYQSGHDETADGKQVSILSVAFDPGRFLKYLGSLMICLGVFAMFYKKAFSFLFAPLARRRQAAASANASGTVAKAAILALLLSAAGASSTFAVEGGAAAFDWHQWQSLPVQNGGRQKPLDTLAWETFRTISNKSSFTDPQTQQKLDSTATYLVLLFTGNGWDRPKTPHGAMGTTGADGCPGQPAAQKADDWDRQPLLLVDSLTWRAALGLPADQKYISFFDLGRAAIEPPETKMKIPFVAWARNLSREDRRELNDFDKKGLELADRYWTYQEVRRGQKLEVLPVADSKTQQWLSVPFLIQTKWDDKNDPTGQIRKAKEELERARTAYRANNAEAFNTASANFIAALGDIGPQLGNYPSPEIIRLEVSYNHWVPFRFAWVCTLLALLGVLLSWASGWRGFYRAAMAFYGAGVVAMLIGFGLRMVISGRAPVTDMYESVVYVGLGIAVIGLLLELIYRRQFVLAAAAAVATVSLILADNCPAHLDSSLRPLQPVLRNNFWLVTHVLTITLSYAAFALALGIADIAMGYYLVRSKNREVLDALSTFIYKTLQVGVLLLAIGTVLGGVWADYAWGRFWGWDPKEVWALIALLGYLALLHARHTGWLGNFGLAAWAAICFSLVIVAWYGVNFVLGAGLHSYGFGGGGQLYVGAVVALQFLYVGAAALRVQPVCKTDLRAEPASKTKEGRVKVEV